MAEKNAEQKGKIHKHFTKEQLNDMSVDDLLDIIGDAPEGSVFHAKGVVRGPDGEVKYDDPTTKGSFDEL